MAQAALASPVHGLEKRISEFKFVLQFTTGYMYIDLLITGRGDANPLPGNHHMHMHTATKNKFAWSPHHLPNLS
jgi:hypothetical protein